MSTCTEEALLVGRARVHYAPGHAQVGKRLSDECFGVVEHALLGAQCASDLQVRVLRTNGHNRVRHIGARRPWAACRTPKACLRVPPSARRELDLCDQINE